MLKQVVAAAALVAGLSVAGSGGAPAQEREYRRIGDWKIISRYEHGRLHRCIGELHSRSGMLRIAHFPDDTWNFSIPCYGESRAQDAEVNLNRATDYLSMNVDGRSCRAWTNALPRGWVAGLRAGGHLSVRLGHAEGNWRLNDSGAALGSIADCVRENR